MKKTKSFFANFVSINEENVSSVNLGFWFFALICVYCLVTFQDIPTNLMTIVITLAVTHGLITLKNMNPNALNAASRLTGIINTGGNPSDLITTVTEAVMTEENTSSIDKNDPTV